MPHGEQSRVELPPTRGNPSPPDGRLQPTRQKKDQDDDQDDAGGAPTIRTPACPMTIGTKAAAQQQDDQEDQ